MGEGRWLPAAVPERLQCLSMMSQATSRSGALTALPEENHSHREVAIDWRELIHIYLFAHTHKSRRGTQHLFLKSLSLPVIKEKYDKEERLMVYD